MQCDSVEIEIPEEYDYRNLEDALPHDLAEHTQLKLSGDLPPEIAEGSEPEDTMLQQGLRMGAADHGRRILTDVKAILSENTHRYSTVRASNEPNRSISKCDCVNRNPHVKSEGEFWGGLQQCSKPTKMCADP